MNINKCEECDQLGRNRKIDPGAGTPVEYVVLCDKHAQEAGFCLECDTLFCYPDNDDVDNISETGFCVSCWEQLTE